GGCWPVGVELEAAAFRLGRGAAGGFDGGSTFAEFFGRGGRLVLGVRRWREEDASHLFMFCDFAAHVWNAIFRWLGVVIIMPPNLFMLLENFMGAAPSNKIGKGFSLIWHTTVWRIWRSRNELCFANGVKDLEKVVDDIKLLSWRWGLSRRKIPICLFYEWCWDPGICLRR
ncbi:pantothenate synthetase, partial [Trifolium medium]|nr:pantothenate synthetase [Trifolium medium]